MLGWRDTVVNLYRPVLLSKLLENSESLALVLGRTEKVMVR